MTKTHIFTCTNCKLEKTHTDDHTTGYGVSEDGQKVCFECCGVQDREYMVEHGKITLYLKEINVLPPDIPGRLMRPEKVTNGLGTLEFKILYHLTGDHNIAGPGSRIDFWFVGPDKRIWWGCQIGQWSQLAHCRKTSGLHGISKIVRENTYFDFDIKIGA